MLHYFAVFEALNLLQKGLLPLPSPSTMHCAYLCLSNVSCSSFFYQESRQKCYTSDLVYLASSMDYSPGIMYFSWNHLGCPLGYTYSRAAQMCYKHGDKQTWDEAKTTCEGEGARLVKVDSQQKQDVMIYLTKEKGHTWTGLRQEEPWSNHFQWTDGTLVNYTDWSRGQPIFSYKCVVVYLLSDLLPVAWHNGLCTYHYHAMCEIPL